MTCQNVRELFPDLLDPRNTAGAKSDPASSVATAEARAHLQHCPACQRELHSLAEIAVALDAVPVPQPSSQLRKNFRAMLEQETHAASRETAPGSAGVPRAMAQMRAGRPRSQVNTVVWRWILAPLAGCALVALGFFAGQRASAPASTTASTLTANETTQRELVALREQINQQRQQLDKMTTLVGYSILQQQQNPANERLRDVLAAARTENVNDKVLDDLIQALTLDPSANVRLRALEALLPHADRATVRAGVLAALPREQNPLVQLELIDFVATAQDPTAAPMLEKIFADESANRTVREAAQLALAQF